MTKFTNALIGTATAAALAVSATPAAARDRDGVSTGDVIAGALIIGGIAAIASAASDNDRYDDRYDRRTDGYAYDRAGYDHRGGYGGGYRMGPRQAVEQCVRATERRLGRGGDVTDVRNIDRTRYGYRVTGRVEVGQYGGRGWRDQYGDRGRFTCIIEGGRVQDVRISGIGRGGRW